MRETKLGMLTLALLTGVFVFGETFTDGNGLVWTYTTSSGNATLSAVERADGQAVSGTLVIPSTVNGATVTAIKENAFAGLSVTELLFAEGVKTINYGVFAGCTSLLSVRFPDSLTTIHGTGSYSRSGAFANCSALTNVTFGSGLVTLGSNTDNQGVFANCDRLETVTFGANLKTIGKRAFTECIALKTLELPDAVQTISKEAFFHNTALASVSFGTGLVSIDESAFSNCPELQSVVFRPSETPLLSIGANAFASATKLKSLTFSESLKILGVIEDDQLRCFRQLHHAGIGDIS